MNDASTAPGNSGAFGPNRWCAVAGTALVLIGTSAAPAWAHDHGTPATIAPDALAIFMHALTVVAAVVAAGLTVFGPSDRVLLSGSAVIAAVAGLLTLDVDVDAAPAPSAVVLALAVLALPVLRHRRRAATITATLVWVLAAVHATVSDRGADRVLGILCTLGVTLWLAVAAATVVAGRGRRPASPHRLAPWAVAGLVLATAGGLLRAWRNGLRPDSTVWWSLFGRLSLLELTLVAAAAVLVAGAVLRRRTAALSTAVPLPIGVLRRRTAALSTAVPLPIGVLRRRTAALSTAVLLPTAVLTVAALTVAAALSAVPVPAAPPVAGVPMLRSVTLDGLPTPVLIVPQRPGWNLVHIGTDQASAGLDRERLTPADARPATTGGWALVRLPAGRSRLWITRGAAAAWLHVDAGRSPVDDQQFAGQDGPECASAVLGAVLAGSRRALPACPAQQLAPVDAEALRAMVRFAADRGVSTISVVGDGSPRSVLAEAEVRAAAAELRLTVAGPGRYPLFVVSGWAAAQATLQQVATGGIAAEGNYLAPWLLTGPLLSASPGSLLPLRFDTRQVEPMRYLDVLDERFPGEPATGVGYAHWAEGSAGTTEPVRLFAASQIFVPGDAGHGHQMASWLPSGAVIPVTGPLTG